MNDETFWNSPGISQRYKRLEQLGHGGSGTIYLAKDLTLQKLVVIKLLRESLSHAQVTAFQREAILMAKLKHQNIASVFDFSITEKNHPYLVAEYIEGMDLDRFCESNREHSIECKVEIFMQIAKGLHHAHSNGIIHRDVKPANVLVREADDVALQVKVTDFGIASLKERDQELTPTRKAIGSPLYMSPEQWTGGAVGVTSDIYSMGCLMFRVLCGEPPFEGDTVLETATLHRDAEVDREKLANAAGVVDPLVAIVLRCLEKKPQKRYQSARELEQELESVAEYIYTVANQIEEKDVSLASVIDERGDRIAEERRRLFLGVLTGMILFCGLVGFLLVRSISQKSVQAEELAPIHVRKMSEPPPYTFKKQTDSNYKELDTYVVEIIDFARMEDEDWKRINQFKSISIVEVKDRDSDCSDLDKIKAKVPSLKVDECPLSDAGLASISRIRGLNTLTLFNCKGYTATGLSQLRNSSSLSCLRLGNQRLDPSTLVGLRGNQGINNLQFLNTTVSNEIMDTVALMPDLGVLYLDACDWNSDAMRKLNKLQKLFNLQLINFKLSDDQVRALNGLEQPISIHLITGKLSDKQVRILISEENESRKFVFRGVELSPTALLSLAGHDVFKTLVVYSSIRRDQKERLRLSLPHLEEFKVEARIQSPPQKKLSDLQQIQNMFKDEETSPKRD